MTSDIDDWTIDQENRAEMEARHDPAMHEFIPSASPYVQTKYCELCGVVRELHGDQGKEIKAHE